MRFIIAGVVLLGLLTGCKRSDAERKSFEKGTVEVAPGVFITVEVNSPGSDSGPRTLYDHTFGGAKKTKDSTELRIPWQGTNVHWKCNCKPLNLRAFQSKLYLIAFDRETKGLDHAHFRYFAQEGAAFKEIQPGAFPRAIAGQNIGFTYRYFMCGNQRADLVQLARDMNPTDPCFASTPTAYIWNHLSAGHQYYESEKNGDVSLVVLQDFVRTNMPIKLTRIAPEGDAWTRPGSPTKAQRTN